jgi:hypothetical protein
MAPGGPVEAEVPDPRIVVDRPSHRRLAETRPARACRPCGNWARARRRPSIRCRPTTATLFTPRLFTNACMRAAACVVQAVGRNRGSADPGSPVQSCASRQPRYQWPCAIFRRSRAGRMMAGPLPALRYCTDTDRSHADWIADPVRQSAAARGATASRAPEQTRIREPTAALPCDPSGIVNVATALDSATASGSTWRASARRSTR